MSQSIKVNFTRVLHLSKMTAFDIDEFPYIFCCGPEKISIVDVKRLKVVIATPAYIRSDSGFNGMCQLNCTNEVVVGMQTGKIKVMTMY